MWLEILGFFIILIIIYHKKLIGQYNFISNLYPLLTLFSNNNNNNAKIVFHRGYIEIQYDLNNVSYKLFVKREYNIDRGNNNKIVGIKGTKYNEINIEHDIPLINPQILGYDKFCIIDENGEVNEVTFD